MNCGSVKINCDKVIHEEVGLSVLKEHRFKGFFSMERGRKVNCNFTGEQTIIKNYFCIIEKLLAKTLKIGTKKKCWE